MRSAKIITYYTRPTPRDSGIPGLMYRVTVFCSLQDPMFHHITVYHKTGSTAVGWHRKTGRIWLNLKNLKKIRELFGDALELIIYTPPCSPPPDLSEIGIYAIQIQNIDSLNPWMFLFFLSHWWKVCLCNAFQIVPSPVGRRSCERLFQILPKRSWVKCYFTRCLFILLMLFTLFTAWKTIHLTGLWLQYVTICFKALEKWLNTWNSSEPPLQ